MENIDNQPIAAGFFKEGRWLTDFIAPNELEVQNLFNEVTKGLEGDVRLVACWQWVAKKVEYFPLIHASISVMGRESSQKDYWAPPELTIRTRVGNCAVKSFLLASLLRNCLPQDQAYCVLGNLNVGGVLSGHAWVTVILNGNEYIMESTRPDVNPLISANSVDRYQPVHYFNDKEIYAVPGATMMYPITACYSSWLKDYLDVAYIQGKK